MRSEVNKVWQVLLFVLAIAGFAGTMRGETIFRKEGTVEVKIYGGGTSSGNFYDLGGKQTSTLKDFAGTDTAQDYTFDFEKIYIGIYGEYSVFDDLTVFGDLPITINSLSETYLSDVSGFRIPRGSWSLTHIEYYGLGARYLLYSRKAYCSAIVEAKLPPGYKRAILDTSSTTFLSDGAFELLGGFDIGFKTESMFLESAILYNYRAKQLVDQVIIHTEAGLTTVPGTKLAVTGDFVMSTGSYKTAIPLNPQRTVTQEDYFAVGFEFSIFFGESVFGEFGYNLRLSGKNSWALGTFRVGMGVLF
jgi:hypothetical protein